MLHRHITSSIDAYLDNELDKQTALEIKEHLDSCPECRKEYELALQLKEGLKASLPTIDPGDTYFDEVTSLIFAKTIDLDTETTAVTDLTRRKAEKRMSFYRSMASVAASLIIFFSALFFGSGTMQTVSITPTASEERTSQAIGMINLADTDNNVIITKDEQKDILKGMVLLGSPGQINRIITLSEIDFAR
ncbi:MAG: anti-sigma factor family protein [Candidatus Zixiibacteriota bacterium]